jgi:sulfite reductase alpha subunit
MHRPAFPYKFKLKFDACPNGCVASIARSDFAVIGIWKDDIKIDASAVSAYVGGEFPPNAGAHSSRDWGKFDIMGEVVDRCPTKCMTWNGSKLSIDNKECTRCMHCINVMPRALRIVDERGAAILVGAKAPVLDGAQMGSLLVPFVEVTQPYTEVKEVLEKIWDWWMEEGKNRERVGETIRRLSFQRLLEVVDMKAMAVHVKEPRHSPYMFFKEEEVGGWDRDLEAYRNRHPR